jgi:hypothetical protein
MHSTVTNTSRLTVPTGGGGKYVIGGYVYWTANATGRRVMRLFKNGATILIDTEMMKEGGGVSSQSFHFVDNAVAADYWELQAFQTSGGNLNVEAVSIPAYFWAYWYST